MDVSIISVNWNSEAYLQQSIESIYRWTKKTSLEIIVVDNASPAGRVDELKKEFPQIKVIKSANNLGFSGANNLGFRESSGEYVLFLNPDTKLTSPAIDVLMERARGLVKPGAIGCKLLNGDLSVQTSSIMKFPRIWNALLQVEYLRVRFPKLWGIGPLFSTGIDPVEVEAISGACILMKRNVFKQVGMFSEEYFMYSEDIDLCYQSIRAGFKNYYLGCASIIHYGGKSTPGARQTIMQTNAQLHFCKKNYGRFYCFLFRTVMLVNAGARVALLAIMRLIATLFGTRSRLDSTWTRWSVILKTLVTSTAP